MDTLNYKDFVKILNEKIDSNLDFQISLAEQALLILENDFDIYEKREKHGLITIKKEDGKIKVKGKIPKAARIAKKILSKLLGLLFKKKKRLKKSGKNTAQIDKRIKKVKDKMKK